MIDYNGIQEVLLNDTRYLAVCLYLKEYSRKSPASSSKILIEFGLGVRSILNELITKEIIEKRTPRSEMVFLSRDGRESLADLERWASALHNQMVEAASQAMVTVQPLRIKNVRVTHGNELNWTPLLPDAIGSQYPVVSKQHFLSTNQRFQNISEGTASSDQRMFNDEFRVPPSVNSSQISQIQKLLEAQKKENKATWQKSY